MLFAFFAQRFFAIIEIEIVVIFVFVSSLSCIFGATRMFFPRLTLFKNSNKDYFDINFKNLDQFMKYQSMQYKPVNVKSFQGQVFPYETCYQYTNHRNQCSVL